MLFAASALFAFVQLVKAQNSTASATDVALIQANFNNAQLVPDLLQKFNPEGVLNVAFGGQEISTGQQMDQSAVQSSPSLTVVPTSDAGDVNTSNKYTVLMIDADIVGTNALSTPLTRHWLVNGASLSGDAPYQVAFDSATTITDYAGPGPAAGSGSHRYTLLVYLQPSSFSAPANLSTAGTPLGTMLLNDYVTESGLGNLVVANYFQVENGQATVSVPATSTVNPSAINGVTSTPAVSRTSDAAASGSTSAASAASGVASPSQSNAASENKVKGWTVAVGAAGVVGAVLGAGLGL